MTISVTYGAATSGTTSLSVAYPSTTPANGTAFILVVNKTQARTPTATGWTTLISRTGATGSAGSNTGQINVSLLQKTALTIGTETSGTTQSVSISSGNSSAGQMFVVGPASDGKVITIVVDSGSDTSTGTSYIMNASTGDLASGIITDDLLIVGMGGNSTASSFSSESISATGITLGSLSEITDFASTSGNHAALVVCEALVISGTSSAEPSFHATGPSGAGAAIFVRIREQDPSMSTIYGSSIIYSYFENITQVPGAHTWNDDASSNHISSSTDIYDTGTTATGKSYMQVFTTPSNPNPNDGGLSGSTTYTDSTTTINQLHISGFFLVPTIANSGSVTPDSFILYYNYIYSVSLGLYFTLQIKLYRYSAGSDWYLIIKDDSGMFYDDGSSLGVLLNNGFHYFLLSINFNDGTSTFVMDDIDYSTSYLTILRFYTFTPSSFTELDVGAFTYGDLAGTNAYPSTNPFGIGCLSVAYSNTTTGLDIYTDSVKSLLKSYIKLSFIPLDSFGMSGFFGV